MDYIYLASLILICIFGFVSVVEDVRRRKVDNRITFSFVLISFAVFLFSTFNLIWMDYIVLFLMMGLGFFIYHKKIWGAADGKLLIALSLLLIASLGAAGALSMLLNIVVFYSLTIIVLVLAKTSAKDKMKIIRSLDYKLSMFLVLIVFALLSIVFYFFSPDVTFSFYVLTIVGVFLLVGAFQKIGKKLYKKMDEDVKFIMIVALFGIFFMFSKIVFLVYFCVFLFFKLFIIFVSNLTQKIKVGGKAYNSPFSLYLFFAALFTLLAHKSVVQIVVMLL